MIKFLERAKKPQFDPEQEKRFRDNFTEKNITSSRLIQGQILVIFLLAGYLDVILLGELATLMVFLRYSVFSPLLFVVFLLSFTPFFKRYMQLMFSISVAIVSCYVALFTFLNEEIIAMLYFAGVILVVFVSFVYVPILFSYALVMSLFVFVMSLLGLLYNESLSSEVIQSSILILLASIALSLIACYVNERNARLNFQYRELLNLEKDSLEERNSRLKTLASHDGLTGIANRRSFDERLQEEWQRAERSHAYLAVLLLDVDFFKPYNDFYGHQQGDECLKRLSKALDGAVGRVGDFVARYGGEEFVIILPNADKQHAYEFAEQLRKKILALKLPHEKSSVADTLTVSIGVASAIPGLGDYTEPEILLRHADRALYQAKSDGRNRVVNFSLAHH